MTPEYDMVSYDMTVWEVRSTLSVNKQPMLVEVFAQDPQGTVLRYQVSAAKAPRAGDTIHVRIAHAS